MSFSVLSKPLKVTASKPTTMLDMTIVKTTVFSGVSTFPLSTYLSFIEPLLTSQISESYGVYSILSSSMVHSAT